MHNALIAAPSDTLVSAAREARTAPDGALVLMHGRGTSEQDLTGLFDLLDPERRLHCAAPRGPLQIPGQPGNHWYFVERVGFPEPQTFGRSLELLADWLAGLASTGVTPDRVVLGGFSQGTVMAYALGLGEGKPKPAGILALSGFVPTVAGVWEPDLESRRGLPVFISHGSRDPVIGVDFARAALELLEPGGLEVSYRESPAGHQIDGPTIDAAREWLEHALPRQPL